MTLADAIRQANDAREPARWAEVIDFCRFKLALDYDRTAATIRKVIPTATPDRFEDLCYLIDTDAPTCPKL